MNDVKSKGGMFAGLQQRLERLPDASDELRYSWKGRSEEW